MSAAPTPSRLGSPRNREIARPARGVLQARAMRTTMVMMVVALAGCMEAKAPVDDDVSAAFAADSKADLPTNTTFLGDLGGKPAPVFPVTYTRTPRYRSIGFWALSGDVVDVRVTSTDGDPVAWLLDFQGNVIAMNDDSSSRSTNSHIHATLTASNGHYYVYFRDYSLHKSHMTVTESSKHVGGSVGDAEAAWDAAVGAGVDGYAIQRASLPAGAAATYDKYVQKFGVANAWSVPGTNGGTYYVVGDSIEEVAWVDIFDANGTFVVHGANGDGDWGPTFWGFPAQSWDPSQQ